MSEFRLGDRVVLMEASGPNNSLVPIDVGTIVSHSGRPSEGFFNVRLTNPPHTAIVPRSRLRHLDNKMLATMGNKVSGGALERVIPGQRFFVDDRVKLNPNHPGAGRFNDCIGTIEFVQQGFGPDAPIYYMVRWAPCREGYALQNPSLVGQKRLLPVNNNNSNMNIDGGRRRKSRKNRKQRGGLELKQRVEAFVDGEWQPGTVSAVTSYMSNVTVAVILDSSPNTFVNLPIASVRPLLPGPAGGPGGPIGGSRRKSRRNRRSTRSRRYASH